MMIEVIRFSKHLQNFKMISQQKYPVSQSLDYSWLGTVLLLERGGLFAWAGIILGIVYCQNIGTTFCWRKNQCFDHSDICSTLGSNVAIIVIWEWRNCQLHEKFRGRQQYGVGAGLDGDTIIFTTRNRKMQRSCAATQKFQ